MNILVVLVRSISGANTGTAGGPLYGTLVRSGLEVPYTLRSLRVRAGLNEND